MDYLGIVKKSWQITWKNKFLWFFGLFVTGGITVFDFNYNMNDSSFGQATKSLGQDKNKIIDFFQNSWLVLVIIGITCLFIFLVLSILNVISQGALIGCVEKIENKKPTSLRDGLSIGLSRFWRILGLNLLIAFVVVITLFVLFAPVITLFVLNMPFRGLALLGLAIIIFAPLVFVLSYSRLFASQEIVLKNRGIIESLGAGFNILKSHIWQIILMALLLLVASIAQGVIIFAAVIVIGIPGVLLGIIGYLIGHSVGLIAAIVPIALLFLILCFIISAIYKTFVSATWTLTYLEIERKK